MESETTLLCLSNDVLVVLLRSVDQKDVFFLMTTCRRLYDLAEEIELETPMSSWFTSVARAEQICDWYEKIPAIVLYNSAAVIGDISVLEVLERRRIAFNSNCVSIALEHGHVDASTYLYHKRGIKLAYYEWNCIGRSGNFELYETFKELELDGASYSELLGGLIDKSHVSVVIKLIEQEHIQVNAWLYHLCLERECMDIFDYLCPGILDYVRSDPDIFDTWTTRRIGRISPIMTERIIIEIPDLIPKVPVLNQKIPVDSFTHLTYRMFFKTISRLSRDTPSRFISYFVKHNWTDLLDRLIELNTSSKNMDDIVCARGESDVLPTVESLKWYLKLYERVRGVEIVKAQKVAREAREKRLKEAEDRSLEMIVNEMMLVRLIKLALMHDDDDLFVCLLSEKFLDIATYLKYHNIVEMVPDGISFKPGLDKLLRYKISFDWSHVINELELCDDTFEEHLRSIFRITLLLNYLEKYGKKCPCTELIPPEIYTKAVNMLAMMN